MPLPGEEITYRDEFIETRVKTTNGKLERETVDLKTGKTMFKTTVTKSGDFKNERREYSQSNTPPKNTKGLIGQFLEHAANIGFQNNNRFIVFINGPSVTNSFVSAATQKNGYLNFGNAGNRNYLRAEQKRRLALTCQEATLAGKSLLTQEYNNTGNGPNTIHAYGENYTNDLTLNFLCSNDFFERMYFETWMQKIVNPGTHEVAMYEDYAKPWSIIVACLPANFFNKRETRNGNINFGSGATLEDVAAQTVPKTTPSDIYFIRYDHVYPYRINDTSIGSGAQSDVMKFSVQFRYHRWYDPVTRYLQAREYRRQNMENLPSAMESRLQYSIRDPKFDQPIEADPHVFSPVKRLASTNYSIYRGMDDMRDVQYEEEQLSPFERFKKIAKDIARYSNPEELKGLLINKGVGLLGNVFGEGNVETFAQGAQVVDVYMQNPDDGYGGITRGLVGPLGNIL
jgi:hypothetical protein